jgi:hypothetical protein
MEIGPRVTSSPSPVDLEIPFEDSGAQTADRYEWQTSMAVVDGLAAITGAWSAGVLTQDISIICEVFEDYVVCIGSSIELVSVKHRDASQGAWTLPQLISRGGVAHLFLRWHELGGRPRSRLVTNASPAAGQPAHFVTLCDRLGASPLGPLRQDDAELFDEVCRKLFADLNTDQRLSSWQVSPDTHSDDFAGMVRDFLCGLRLESDRTNRADLEFAAPSKYVAPFLVAIGADPGLAPAVWQQAVQLFRAPMRGRGSTDLGGLSNALIHVHNLTAAQAAKIHLEARRVSAADLLEVVAICQELSLGVVPPHRELAPTVLGIKLINAGLTATTVHMAEDAALLWRKYESESDRDAFGEMSAVANAKHAIHEIASAVHEELVSSGITSYGTTMWLRLMNTFSPESLSSTPSGLSKSLMIGALCDLASQCKVWFSPEFDLAMAKSSFPSRILDEDTSHAA